MKLTLSPTMGLPDQPETTLHVAGYIITIDGTPYDLSPVPEGGEATAEDSPFVGKITRINGVINCTVMVQLDSTAADDQGIDPWIIENATGDIITIDGTPYDLSPVPDGGEATAEDSPFVGKITRVNGVIHCAVLVRLGAAAADDQPGSPWVIEAADGDVEIPVERKPVEEVTE